MACIKWFRGLACHKRFWLQKAPTLIAAYTNNLHPLDLEKSHVTVYKLVYIGLYKKKHLHFWRLLQFVLYPLTVFWGHSVELVDSFKMVPSFNSQWQYNLLCFLSSYPSLFKCFENEVSCFGQCRYCAGVVRDHRMGGWHTGLASHARGALCVHPWDVIF